jgi:hypothetical protein
MGRFSTFYQAVKFGGLAKSQKPLFFVIPAKAGIQSFQALLGSRLSGSDGLEDFYRENPPWPPF